MASIDQGNIFREMMEASDYKFGSLHPGENPRGAGFNYKKLEDADALTVANLEELSAGRTNQLRIFTFIKLTELEYLFRNDLKSSQRMFMEWKNANRVWWLSKPGQDYKNYC